MLICFARSCRTRGCPIAVFPSRVWYEVGDTLRLPSGRIHWAGTETARRNQVNCISLQLVTAVLFSRQRLYCQGFIDGAIEAGRRAAGEVVSRLKDGNDADVITRIKKVPAEQQRQFRLWRVLLTSKWVLG